MGQAGRHHRRTHRRPPRQALPARIRRSYPDPDGGRNHPAENGSYADYPSAVAQWYERIAQSVLKALQSTEVHALVAADEELWTGPRLNWPTQPTDCESHDASAACRVVPFTVAGLPRVAQGILILFFATGFPAQRIHQGAGRIMSS